MGYNVMSVYNINGNEIDMCYQKDGTALSYAYDVDENIVYDGSGGSGSDTDPYIAGRVLAWEETFAGASGDAPDTTHWAHEVGKTRNTWALQYYTDGNRNSCLDGNGHLAIHAVKEAMEGSTWSSACIHTNNIFEFTYGRIDAKLKLPNLAGCVPAFWMLGACLEVVPLGYYDTTTKKHAVEKGIRTPLTPEVDIVEQFGAASTIQSAVHCGTEEDGAYTLHYMPTLEIEDTSEWHVYSVEWTSKKLSWYVDDIAVGTTTAVQSYPMLNNPMYILLNLAIGNVNGSGTASVDEMHMYADWVRVYLPEGVLEKYPVKSVSLSQQSLELTEGDTSIIDFTFTPSLCWNKTLIWTSSNTSIAEVYGGKVYAISKGTCTITATAHNGISASCIVTVNASL